MAEFMKAATVEAIPPGTAQQLTLAGTTIALFNIDGEFYAIDNTCTHQGGPLAEGTVEGDEVICPWHGAVFNIKTGEVQGPPAGRNVSSFPVRVNGSDIEVAI